MTKRIVFLAASLVVAAAISLAACSKPAPAPAPSPTSAPTAKPTPAPAVQPIEWVFAHTTASPGTTWEIVNNKEIADRLEKATNGRLKMKVLVGVINGADGIVALKDGRAQAADLIYAYLDSTYPLWSVVSLPGLVPSWQKAIDPFIKVLQPIVAAETSKTYGARLVVNGFFSGGAWFSKTPLKTMDDFKGLKVRTDSVYRANMAKALGGAPVAMPVTEVYTSIERGVIDAFSGAAPSVLGSKFYEVVKYMNMWTCIGSSWGTFVSEKALAALPADVRAQVEAELKAMELQYQRELDLAVEVTKTLLEKQGMTQIIPASDELTKAQAIIEPAVFDPWYKLTGDAGKNAVAQVRAILAAQK